MAEAVGRCVSDVLDFWFLAEGAEGYGASRPEWWRKSEEFDATVRARFGSLVEQAVAGELEAAWKATPRGALAHIILLDQFTRNIYRGTAAAWSGDERALRCANDMVESGALLELAPPMLQTFALMPLMHAEDAASQDISVREFTALAQRSPTASFVSFAEKHRDCIAQYGRFPSRNQYLGRESSQAELDYLEAGGGF